MEKIKVHLMGGDQIGWALDQDLATTHFALNGLGEILELTSLEDADVVHSVWEEPLLDLEPQLLVGKRNVCHICNDVCKTFENDFMVESISRIGMWIPISRKAAVDLDALNLPNTYIPYTLDPKYFSEYLEARRKDELVKKYRIPSDRYIIGNFMRDTLGSDLTRPKEQKGADIFLQIILGLQEKGVPFHILLAGPRRHWLKKQLDTHGISFTYIGKEVQGDDNDINLLSQKEMGELYHLIDANVVTSRWEGGPRCVLEGAATRTKVVSGRVGLAADLLEPQCLYSSVSEAINILIEDVAKGSLNKTVEVQYNRYVKGFQPECNIPRFRKLYEQIADVSPFKPVNKRWQYSSAKETITATVGRVKKAYTIFRHGRRKGAGLHLGIWHEFHKPPYGGGNQFMIALTKALRESGIKVSVNSSSPFIDVHICNSAWFEVRKLSRLRSRRQLRIIHRVDGPIALYRQSDWREDEKIYALNKEWATATVYQSAWCMKKLLELQFDPVRPVIIHNGIDNAIFHRPRKKQPILGRKIRLISTAWSDNPKKGGPFYRAMEERLDWDQFTYTFVGRCKEHFKRINHIPAQDSQKLADILREHDIYIMASESEACSNALLEALACGLPTLYLNDGGNGELVGYGGLPFTDLDNAMDGLHVLSSDYERYRASIWVKGIDEIAQRYLDVAERLMSL